MDILRNNWEQHPQLGGGTEHRGVDVTCMGCVAGDRTHRSVDVNAIINNRQQVKGKRGEARRVLGQSSNSVGGSILDTNFME